ncbi:MAG: AAA family ATPase [Deltaproteobacteria bacterium]|nr:AAA family ATPase [Deltaproteobacteria bacterium]MBW2389403.1 AAA family ATPase [Deltaproteobacteria bacterium]
MEHLHHFGLKLDPFQNEPDLRFYFDSVSHIAPYRRIERGLRQNKGLCVMTGEGGTGKTLLTRRLLEGLEEEIFDAQLMLMMPGATDATSVLSRYARMVGVEDADDDRPAQLAQIYEQLAIVREEGRHSVLMLDDAQLLSMQALAEIGGLLNLEYEDRRLVSLLLVGLPQLDVTLSHEPSLAQRIDVRARLEPLDYENSAEYILHRLGHGGGGPEMIPPDAMSALYKFGRGRPRLLNTLADNAMFEAYLAGRAQLATEDIERAAADLGIGDAPGSTYSANRSPDSQGVADPGSMEASHQPMVDLSQVADLEIGAASLDASVTDAPLGLQSDDPGLDEGASASAIDLGELADSGSVAISEPTTENPPGMSGIETNDLDSAVEEMLSEGNAATDFPVFAGHNDPNPGGAEPTQFGLQEDLLQGSPVASEDELDDLFVELIDE